MEELVIQQEVKKLANFDYDTKMVMSETEFTTLPGDEQVVKPIQYVTLSESMADPTKDAELYIEAEVWGLTDKGFILVALVQDESEVL